MLKAEMVNSLSKKNQRSPRSMDVLVVCRKHRSATPLASNIAAAVNHAHGRIHALVAMVRSRLRADARSIMLASVLSLLTNPDIVADGDDLIARGEPSRQRDPSSGCSTLCHLSSGRA